MIRKKKKSTNFERLYSGTILGFILMAFNNPKCTAANLNSSHYSFAFLIQCEI